MFLVIGVCANNRDAAISFSNSISVNVSMHIRVG